MITELSPADTEIEVGDQIRVEGFEPFLTVIGVGPALTIRYRGVEQPIRRNTVRLVRKAEVR